MYLREGGVEGSFSEPQEQHNDERVTHQLANEVIVNGIKIKHISQEQGFHMINIYDSIYTLYIYITFYLMSIF